MHYLARGATGTRKLEPGSSEVKPGLIRAFLYIEPGRNRVRTSPQNYFGSQKVANELSVDLCIKFVIICKLIIGETICKK